MDFSYKFPAARGRQANREYYIAMVPLKYIGRLFPRDDSAVIPEYRAQRRLNEARIPEMSDYIINNRDNYVFTALAASIDGEYSFLESEINDEVGTLEIDMAAKLLINDGQHRKAAILSAIERDESLGEETISIVFYKDKGLVRSQQMFADLNKHAVKTSNSLSALYDMRDPVSAMARLVVDKIKFFSTYTEVESDSIGKNSAKLFTLNHIKKAIEIMTRENTLGLDENKTNEFVVEYWKQVSDNISEWNQVLNGSLTKVSLREDYILTLGITLKAFGKVGAIYYNNGDLDFSKLALLKDINWLRRSSNWKERVLKIDGKVDSSDAAIMLTSNKIKTLIGLKLTREETAKEEAIKLKRNKR